MNNCCIGILAHVDAGKTTLSEAMLYLTGQIKKIGRVDHKDAFLDTDTMEKERGITIFSKQAIIEGEDFCATLLDTPGHVDFSAEMERTLQVLDYAILVVSATDGVQGHTRTLVRLLRHYNIPFFIFVNKMDLSENTKEELMSELKSEIDDACVDLSTEKNEGQRMNELDNDLSDEMLDELSMCSEDMMNSYLETGSIEHQMIVDAIAKRNLFPVYFGSALKLEGVNELIAGLKNYCRQPKYDNEFAAKVYKIARDDKGKRLTFLKIMGGSLKPKDIISYHEENEKVDEIRIYSGSKYTNVNMLEAGHVCAVTGLTKTYPGLGLGACQALENTLLEPVLTYKLIIPDDVNKLDFLDKLKTLEDEDPKLKIEWDERFSEINIKLMGAVQMEILTRLIRDRFGVVVTFGPGNIVYKETIAGPSEGVGHFEPLRHYAEVHLLVEPAERNTGVTVESACSEDILDKNWQRLIATHVEERLHKGVLTGSYLTDLKITILTGRAHNKHTEGGDFRQATYRAIRNALKRGSSILLEPYYNFLLEVPMDYVGRAMSDIQNRFGNVGTPEFYQRKSLNMAKLTGRAPVACMQDYVSEVHAYTNGLGSLTLELSGYDVCHNSEEVIEKVAYDSEMDFKNPTGSVFCAHGAGFNVPWDQVEEYMHLPFVYMADGSIKNDISDGMYYDTSSAMEGNSILKRSKDGFHDSWEKSISSMSEVELDKELLDVYEREFGMSKKSMDDERIRKWSSSKKKLTDDELAIKNARHIKYDKAGNPIYPKQKKTEEYLIVDGYNIIFAWEDLKELSKANIDSARDRLKDILLNYQAFKGINLVLVFDAYRVKGNAGKKEIYDGKSKSKGKEADTKAKIEVVYTKENELADTYIERLVHELRDKAKITVASSDGLEQQTILSLGALRMSAAELKLIIDQESKI